MANYTVYEDNVARRQEILTRWVPNGIKITDILNIIHEFGLDNDTMTEEEYDDNIVPYEITITIQKKFDTDKG